jgi:hypothetical protein
MCFKYPATLAQYSVVVSNFLLLLISTAGAKYLEHLKQCRSLSTSENFLFLSLPLRTGVVSATPALERRYLVCVFLVSLEFLKFVVVYSDPLGKLGVGTLIHVT